MKMIFFSPIIDLEAELVDADIVEMPKSDGTKSYIDDWEDDDDDDDDD
ncbi:MAG: hypothetical protein KBT22_00880 [Bacteroidales bacterium]|nr:hypothetical protein [Candidatus Scybalocola fimicaballi]